MSETEEIKIIPLTHAEFTAKLKSLGLDKKEFAKLTGVAHQTTINWSYKPIPAWVKSWLEYYSDSIQLRALQKIMRGQ
ncbi:MAG: XRE family transcriptional regulator [Campylobacteraceae bacterium]|jgi:hypothetical protein|nr:XRE family transcriptional regulator [Campylobacteraceae bacterium]